ncbi:hypothetical protein BLL52_2929 [Rhodoferax antarcticus ANT.BR]|uniref:Uncharacterized protein n=1 Tax=Rhodoferax antarcticus ANT.BR TaxID=1111071 RepID=A0A1Q8YF69_9BURK|nr:hypothetical protein BLL52_2929 [Rhodoferax antarcticus ANT.BR]
MQRDNALWLGGGHVGLTLKRGEGPGAISAIGDAGILSRAPAYEWQGLFALT